MIAFATKTTGAKVLGPAHCLWLGVLSKVALPLLIF